MARKPKGNNSRTRISEKSTSRGRNGKPIEDRDSVKNPGKSGNDPAWYASNPAILRDAASYPFSYATGATDIHNVNVYNSNIEFKPVRSVPGVCSLHVYPGIGTSTEATDPVNVAAQSVYSFVRHANSGHANYDAPDLMMYILAMANMYSFLVWCQRLYGYALTYDQRNRYIPRDLIRTNGVNPNSLINNLANFRFWLNTLIAKMVSFAVPATMSIFSRMSFMYSDYYIEGTSIKEQLYQYVPEGFYKFGIDSDSLGNLTWEPFDYSTLMSVNDIITYGDALFNAIWSQEDFGIMSGDVLKAYGDNIIKLAPLPEYYNIIPKFDPMILTQMKNADMVRVNPVRVFQDATGLIKQVLSPKGFTATDTFYGVNDVLTAGAVTIMNNALNGIIRDYSVLTVDTDDPGPEIVIEATRLKVGYDEDKAWYKVGTEMITHAVITVTPGSDYQVPPIICGIAAVAGYATNYAEIDRLLSFGVMFHYMPRLYVATFNNANSKGMVTCFYDVDNFTILTYEDIRKLHEAATINMFAVPSIGKVM